MSAYKCLSFVSGKLGNEYREQVFVLSLEDGMGVKVRGKVFGVQDILKVLRTSCIGELKIPRSPKATVRVLSQASPNEYVFVENIRIPNFLKTGCHRHREKKPKNIHTRDEYIHMYYPGYIP